MRFPIPILPLLIVALVGLAGCNGQSKSHSDGKPDSITDADAIKALHAAEVTDAGGIDDQSFNASAWEGLKKAKNELGIEIRYLESKEQSDYKERLSTLADQGNDVVFAVG